MDKEMFDALMEVIDARIDERVLDALNRDSLSETIRVSKLRKEFEQKFIKD